MVLACSTGEAPCPCPTRDPSTRASARPGPLPARRCSVEPADGCGPWSWRSSGSPSAPPRRSPRRPSRSSRGLRSPCRGPRRARTARRPSRSRSTAAATATASGCRSTARAVGPSPARTRPRSSPTTTPGTTLGTTDPKRAVRILVLQSFKPTATKPLRLYGRGGSWTIDGIAGSFPADAQLRVTKTTTGFRLVVRGATGALLLDHPSAGSVRVRAGAKAGARIQVFSKPGAYDRYRGVIRLRSTKSGIDAINETQLDLYLRGVVPAEMPASWPVEALRAQAIAARSYAGHRIHARTGSVGPVRRLADPGLPRFAGRAEGDDRGDRGHGRGRGPERDARSPTRCSTRRAAAPPRTTRTCSRARPARSWPAPCPISAAQPTAHRTASTFDDGAPRETWKTASYSYAQLSAIFGADARTNVGSLTGLDLSNVGVSGRLISVTLTGSLGTKRCPGPSSGRSSTPSRRRPTRTCGARSSRRRRSRSAGAARGPPPVQLRSVSRDIGSSRAGGRRRVRRSA